MLNVDFAINLSGGHLTSARYASYRYRDSIPVDANISIEDLHSTAKSITGENVAWDVNHVSSNMNTLYFQHHKHQHHEHHFELSLPFNINVSDAVVSTSAATNVPIASVKESIPDDLRNIARQTEPHLRIDTSPSSFENNKWTEFSKQHSSLSDSFRTATTPIFLDEYSEKNLAPFQLNTQHSAHELDSSQGLFTKEALTSQASVHMKAVDLFQPYEYICPIPLHSQGTPNTYTITNAEFYRAAGYAMYEQLSNDAYALITDPIGTVVKSAESFSQLSLDLALTMDYPRKLFGYGSITDYFPIAAPRQLQAVSRVKNLVHDISILTETYLLASPLKRAVMQFHFAANSVDMFTVLN